MHIKRNDYWAAAPIETIAQEILGQFESFRKWGEQTGYFERIVASYESFYGMDSDGTLRVVRGEDDVAELKDNQLKSLVKRLHIMVTENKLAYQPRAKNSDSKSQIESDLARGICEYYGDEKHMHRTMSTAVLQALIMLDVFVHTPWSVTEGYELTADGGQVIKSGDQKFEVFGPFSVARSRSVANSPWYILRTKVNRYDEAVLNPDLAEEILKADAAPDEYDMSFGTGGNSNTSADQDEDMCWKYILYHGRTPALPNGRRVEVIGTSVTFDSGDKGLRYTRVPVFRLSAGEILETVCGDSPLIDLLPLQDALDRLMSGVTTNALNNAIQMIHSPDPNLTTRKLGDGQTLVTSSAPPTGLNLTGSASETYKLIELLIQHEQLLSGVNDVARGNPAASLKSGTSLAVVLAQAIQYVSDLQSNYAMVAGDVATQLINNIQTFATEELTAYIVGASRKGQIKTFMAKDLMNVARMTVDLGNPLTQSFAGRNEMVAVWQQYGIIKDPKQIITFLRTGELDGATENPFSDALRVRECNEMLRKGQVPAVLITDNHAELIVGAKGIMSGEEARENPNMVGAFSAFVMDCIAKMRMVPPDLAAILAGQPLPPPPVTNVPPPGQPQVQGAPMPNVPQGTPPQVAANYQEALNAQANQPQVPVPAPAA